MSNGTRKKKEETSIVDTILGIAAVIGGAWLLGKLLDNNSEKKRKYNCPNCNSVIDYQQPECNACKTKLKWDF